MAELLFELFGEEIPARMQKNALAELQRLVEEGLKTHELPSTSVQTMVTPRRLVFIIDGIPEQQADRRVEKKGPKIDAPQAAIDGFLKSIGKTIDQVEKQDSPKGPIYIDVEIQKGRKTIEVLPEILTDALNKLPWPKSMRWNDRQLRWVRPIHNILAVFGGEVLDLQFGHLKANNQCVGHRFMAPTPQKVSNSQEYLAAMAAGKVMADHNQRRTSIAEQCHEWADELGVVWVDDQKLLDEVTGLVEWPVVLAGKIPDAFMTIPSEVLIATMRDNQRYFVTRTASGEMTPHFFVTANIETPDKGAAIVAGNERVLRARLSDARFFWENDLQVPLEDRLPKLAQLVFHAKLGSVKDKAERLQKLAGFLSNFTHARKDMAERAGLLAKADLVSEMVFEFPEVQGRMGYYYARQHGEPEALASAIADHYSPLGPDDDCPKEPLSVTVALADKIDTLVGFFAVGERPTGSKDPFALRRAALGVIRLILENEIKYLNLKEVFDVAANGYGLPSPAADLLVFFADRLKVYLKERDVRHDHIQAIFALGDEQDLVRLIARVKALSGFVDSAEGANLLAGYKRAVNILKAEEKKDKKPISGAVEPDQLVLEPEIALYEGLHAVAKGCAPYLRDEDFAGAMGQLAQLRPLVDAFFDKVTVNDADSDKRLNRLRLLAMFRGEFHRLADFSSLEG